MHSERIGFTCSSFDLLHAGHVAMLKESKQNCDFLIVGLNAKPLKNGRPPVQNLVERWTQLNAVKYVDQIIPYDGEDELLDLLKLHNPDVRFIGEDYRNKPFTGNDLNIEVFYNARHHRFSSAALKKHIRDDNSDS
jgi:glycerol-3-phosphate cytidylyltransferase|tara:strand:- start:825 stop:1232 length:408 start_codon:yes stop_codon:yes gene_type:complete